MDFLSRPPGLLVACASLILAAWILLRVTRGPRRALESFTFNTLGKRWPSYGALWFVEKWAEGEARARDHGKKRAPCVECESPTLSHDGSGRCGRCIARAERAERRAAPEAPTEGSETEPGRIPAVDSNS